MASAQLAEHLWPTEEDPTIKISQYPLQAAKKIMPGQRVTGEITLPQSVRVVHIRAPGAEPGFDDAGECYVVFGRGVEIFSGSFEAI
ncbi:MAG: hypothetical protein V3S21_00460 [Xanthomonadales bacterium]